MNRRLLFIALIRSAFLGKGTTFWKSDKSKCALNGYSFTISKRMLFTIFFLLIGSMTLLTAQTTVNITGNGTHTLNVVGGVDTEYSIVMPSNCTANVTYQAWGGGGGGGRLNNRGVGGGGSGAYLNCTIPVALDCGMTYLATVGAGGVGASVGVDASDGGDTEVNFGAAETAEGGSDGTGNAGGPGGGGSGCGFVPGVMGDARSASPFNGGNGGAAPGGGVGGIGGVGQNIAGTDGGFPGGGGGGHGPDDNVDPVTGDSAPMVPSGNGGHGQIILVISNFQCIEVEAGPDQTICAGETATLTGAVTMGTAVSYAWDNGAGAVASPMVTPAATTTYTVTATDASGCTDTDDVTVTVTPTTVTPPTVTFCTEDKATNLTNYNADLLSGHAGTVTWYNRNPSGANGSVIPTPTCFDLTSLINDTHLWAIVDITDPSSCAFGSHRVNLPINEISCIKWTGLAGDGLWETPGNWAGGVAPTDEDNILLNVSGTITFTDQLRVDETGVLIIGPCTTLNIGDPAVASDATPLRVEATLINNGCINIINTTDDRGIFFVAGSNIRNTGTISSVGVVNGIDTRGIFVNSGVLISDPAINLVNSGFTNFGAVFTGGTTGSGAPIPIAGPVTAAPASTKNPGPTATTAILEGCGADGFTLTDADARILGGQSPTDFIVSYHETLEDAICSTNPLSSPYASTGQKQTIYASVIDKNTGCCTTVPVSLLSFGASALLDTVNICANDLVDLTTFDGIILGGQPGSVTWYNRNPNGANGTLIPNPTAFDINSLILPTHLFAVASFGTTVSCESRLNVPFTLLTDCVTWTGCGDGTTWEDGANWSTGSTPGGRIDTCVKIRNNTCPITRASDLRIDNDGYLDIGPGISLVISGSGTNGLEVMGSLVNQGNITVNAGFNSGVRVSSGGVLNNTSCGSIRSNGINDAFFANPAGSIFNAGTFEAFGANNGVNIRFVLANSGTIISDSNIRIDGQFNNSGNIFSPSQNSTDNGIFCGNPIQVGACPSITTDFAGVCIGGTTTLAGTNGDIFTSLSPSIASIDPVTGIITGISTGTTCITYTNTTSGCQVSRTITVHDAIVAETISIETCGNLSCLNLNSQASSILGGTKGEIEWFFGNPNESGVLISNPSEVDYSQLDNVWARSRLTGCVDCESVSKINFILDNTDCCTDCQTAVWVGGDTGDWNDPSNWSTGNVPTTTTQVTIREDVLITGISGCGIDRLVVPDSVCVQLALEDGLNVARNCTRGGSVNAVTVGRGGSLCMDSGDYNFSGGNTCDNISDVILSRGDINIAPGVNVTISPGNAIAHSGTSDNGVSIREGLLNNCGLLHVLGGFRGNGIEANGGDIFNTGNIVIESVITGIAFDIRGGSVVTNECTGSILNNNITDADIEIRTDAILFNYGYIRSSSNPSEGIRVRNTGGAINIGFFHNTNGTTRFATGTGVTDLGSFTTHDNIKQIILDPDLEFKCSGQNRPCGCKETDTSIPTMSEWGLFIFLLLLLNLGVIFLYRLEKLKQVY